MNLINFIILLILTAFAIATAPSIDVLFFIQSQDAKYQYEFTQKLKENIIKQSVELQPNYRIKVHLLHEIFNYPGGWTIHNLIPQLMLLQRKHKKDMNTNADTHTNDEKDMEIINDKTRWIIFCEDKTKVKVKLLMEKLNNENHTQSLYLGHSLYDREPTIIHHFAFFENPKWFPYPMLPSGIVLSMPLFKSIADIYFDSNSKHLKQQFSIDAGHELARMIYDNIQIPVATSTMSLQNYESKNHRTNSHRANIPAASEPKRTTTLRHPNCISTEGTTNISEVPYSDYCTSMNINKINVEHKNKKSKHRAAINPTTTFSKRKIILKKASYICPTATWDNNSKSSNGSNDNEPCAMYAERTTDAASSMTCASAKREEIYFAVKTCSKYHEDRLKIIQSTWAPYAKYVKYFSDVQDDQIPTTNTGVPNVEMGHCAKTLRILKLALRDIESHNNKQHHLHHVKQGKHTNHQIRWLFLSDDDTLLSVSGVCQVLGCYNSIDDIYLGERYGYRLYAQDGFNYITGGGGIAFSLPVVRLILQHCSCPSPTAPDDMILGSCLHSLQLKALHSSRFHQARPNDYPLELLQLEAPVTFHKFWQLDPMAVYNHWFAAQDNLLLPDKNYFEKSNDVGHRLLAETESCKLKKLPVPMMTSLHHSKEHHVDL